MSDQQTALLDDVNKLRDQMGQAELPQGMRDKLEEMLSRLERSAKFGVYSEDYERTAHYLEWVLKIPWKIRTQDRLDLDQTKRIMDQHHYGLDQVKQRILEHLSVLKLNIEQNRTDIISRAPILLLVGLAGTGKTSFGYALAESMNRKIARIPFGGMGSARDLRGQSKLHLEAEPGAIVKGLINAGSINSILLLDEIDRVAEHARADVMGVLLALLDPSQNKAFLDHYIDYPINLNEVLFIATSNNTDNISTAVLNRLEVIHMPTYSDEEKIIIGKHYVLPTALKEAGLAADALIIPDEIWPSLVRPLGFDSGIRVLKRMIENLTRRVAYLIVSGEVDRVVITPENLNQFVDQYIT